MRNMILFVFGFFILIFGGCDLDNFLFNVKSIEEYTLPGNTIPDSLIQQVTFDSGGNTLYGYWIDSHFPNSPDFFTPRIYMRSVTILYCHGNKHNMDYYWDRVMYLHRLGANVFIFDYRGFGLSEGESSEQGLYEDGSAALEYLKSRPDFLIDKLCLYGYSLGNVVSIYLAAEKVDPFCLIAEAPFASANSLTQGSSILDLPAGWLTDGEFDNVEKIKEINTPLYVLCGRDDDFVRTKDNGWFIYNNAPPPKRWKQVPQANHEDIPEILGITQYLHHINDWISKSLFEFTHR